MTGSRPAMVLAIGLLAMLLGGTAQAQAQEDLAAGKSPAQLFHQNCAECHKSPRGLAAAGEKVSGLSGLEGFLAEHYTASTRSADIIASYLKSVGGAAPSRNTGRQRRNTAKPHKPTGKTETANKSSKPDKTKTGAAKTTDETSANPKSAKPKADEPAMTEQKPEKKKPASQSSQAKHEKPLPAEKKTD